MSNIWELLPPAVAERLKAILAVVGGIAFVVVSFYPGLATDHYVSVVIAVLTVLGVYTIPNKPAAKPGIS